MGAQRLLEAGLLRRGYCIEEGYSGKLAGVGVLEGGRDGFALRRRMTVFVFQRQAIRLQDKVGRYCVRMRTADGAETMEDEGFESRRATCSPHDLSGCKANGGILPWI